MVYRVVSTKLTEEEHTKLLDVCNREGCSPSSLIKDAVLNKIEEKEKPVSKMSVSELLREMKEKEAVELD